MMLKETERVAFTEPLHSFGTREVLVPHILQRRLLLCLHSLGTNADLKRCVVGAAKTGMPQYVRRRQRGSGSTGNPAAGPLEAAPAVSDVQCPGYSPPERFSALYERTVPASRMTASR